MILAYAYCNVSVMPMRKAPTHTAEQVNELLFGELSEVLEINDNDWARIRCGLDDYEGWCKAGQLLFVHRKEYRRENKYVTARHGDKLVFEESEMWLPMGADLRGIKGGKVIIHNKAAKFKGRRLATKKMELNADTLKDAALRYMNAPYLWGGRTIAGIDCSGLTQMAFKLCGKALPRDASLQALEGDAVDFLQNSHCGDLAFFDNAEGNITHVGIILDAQNIIHATDTSGRVVIDRIDQGGIISTSLRKRTHNLRFVKRYF